MIRLLSYLSLAIFTGCILFSEIYQVGVHVYRSHALILPLLVASLIVFIVQVLEKRFFSAPVVIIISLSLFYIFVRATFTDSFHSVSYDFNLLFTVFLIFVNGSYFLKRDSYKQFLAGVAYVVFAVQVATYISSEFLGLENYINWTSLFNQDNANEESYGSMTHKNAFALLLLFKVIFADMCLRQRFKIIYPITLSLLVVVSMIAVYTGARGAFFVSALSFLFYCFGSLSYFYRKFKGKHGKRNAILISSGGLLLTLFIAIKILNSGGEAVYEVRGKKLDFSQIYTDDVRGKLTYLAFDQFTQKPFFGKGADSFKNEFPALREHIKIPLVTGDARFVHNDIMQILCEYGIVGFLTLTISLLTAAKHSFQKWNGTYIITCFLVILFICLMSDFIMRVPIVAITATLLAAVLFPLKEKQNLKHHLANGCVMLVLFILCLKLNGLALLNPYLGVKYSTAHENDKQVLGTHLVKQSNDYHLHQKIGYQCYLNYLKLNVSEDLMQAEQMLIRSIELNPANGFAYLKLAEIQSHIDFEKSRRNLAVAKKILKKRFLWVGGYETAYRVYLNTGGKLWKQRKSNEALSFFSQSKKYLATSRRYSRRVAKNEDVWRKKYNEISSQINFLQEAGIEPSGNTLPLFDK